MGLKPILWRWSRVARLGFTSSSSSSKEIERYPFSGEREQQRPLRQVLFLPRSSLSIRRFWGKAWYSGYHAEERKSRARVYRQSGDHFVYVYARDYPGGKEEISGAKGNVFQQELLASIAPEPGATGTKHHAAHCMSEMLRKAQYIHLCPGRSTLNRHRHLSQRTCGLPQTTRKSMIPTLTSRWCIWTTVIPNLTCQSTLSWASVNMRL